MVPLMFLTRRSSITGDWAGHHVHSADVSESASRRQQSTSGLAATVCHELIEFRFVLGSP